MQPQDFPISDPTARTKRPWTRDRVTLVAIFGFLLLAPCILFVFAYPLGEWFSYIAARPRFDRHYEKDLLPGSKWVSQYLEKHGRLPTQEEYRASRLEAGEFWGSGLITQNFGDPTGSLTGNQFMIATATGEWSLYYQSWDGKRWWVYTE